MLRGFPIQVEIPKDEMTLKRLIQEIITAKVHQKAEVRAFLEKFDGNITFAEGPSICSGGLDSTKKKSLCILITKTGMATIELDSYTKTG